MSNIDPNIPAAGSEMRSAPLRANFRAAFEEITALQGGGGAGASGTSFGRDNQISPNATSYTVLGQNNVVGLESDYWNGSRSLYDVVVVGRWNTVAGASASWGANETNFVFGSENDLGPASDEGYHFRQVHRNIVVGRGNRFGERYDACATPRMYDQTVIGHYNYHIARGQWSGDDHTLNRSIVLGNDNYVYAYGSVYDDIIIGHGHYWHGDTLSNCITIGNWAPVYDYGAWIGGSNIGFISYGDGTGTMFTDWSDQRLKDNVADADVNRCLTDISRLKVTRFSYKKFVGNGDEGQDGTRTGFLSSDFAQVFPKSVHRKPYAHGGRLEQSDEGSRMVDQQIIQDCESIDQSQLIPTLVGAVQALANTVKNLQRQRR